LSALENDIMALDMLAVVHVLQSFKLKPLAYKGGNTAQRMAAQGAGLVLADDASWLKVAQQVSESSPVDPALLPPTTPQALTQYVDKPLRSGQQFYARGADLVVTAMVNAGAEVVADG
ncbi:septum site-determining protein MinC, partial [Arthrospira platensis SPKY1]|nr:septum site-determining protein MinC [Arthrospira platensis SPKY1]